MTSLGDMMVAPWWRCDWRGEAHSIGGADTTMPDEADVAKILYYGHTGDEWDGKAAGIAALADGRLVAWETWWGPTGSGFVEDAYGGEAAAWFAPAESLRVLVLSALTDEGRELCGIPREGLA